VGGGGEGGYFWCERDIGSDEVFCPSTVLGYVHTSGN